LENRCDLELFELKAGEVHCLLGENGAGKSTLMKILSGALSKDGGSILVDGQEARIASPADSQKYGIGMIYQDFKLVPELSVAENILLGNEPLRAGTPFIDYPAMHERARQILSQLREEIDPAEKISSLSIANAKSSKSPKRFRGKYAFSRWTSHPRH